MLAKILVAVLTFAGPDLALSPSDLSQSVAIPVRGERVKLQVTVRNLGDTASPPARVRGRAFCYWEERPLGPPQPVPPLAPGGAHTVEFHWRPKQTGPYELLFRISAAHDPAGNNTVLLDLPVVARRVYLAWYHEVPSLRHINVALTVPPEERDYWQRRGVIPCAWVGGMCYRERPLEWFIDHWLKAPAVAVDEFAPGVGDKLVAAARAVKERHPDNFLAMWFSGGYEYWPQLREVVDLFLPEVYLNYLGFNVERFDAALRAARTAGVLSKTALGLGINSREAGARRDLTPEQLRQQFIYLKRAAPAVGGVAFFHAAATPPGLLEVADQLCYDYFLAPVIKVTDLALTPPTPQAGKEASLQVRLTNVGNMDARHVQVEVRLVRPRRRSSPPLVVWNLPRLTVGETASRTESFPVPPGNTRLRVRVVPRRRYTVLDGQQEVVLLASPPPVGPALDVAVPPPKTPVPARLLQLPLPSTAPRAEVWRLQQLDGTGQVVAEGFAQRVFSGPAGEAYLTWTDRNPPNQKDQHPSINTRDFRYFRFLPTEAKAPPGVKREGWTFRTAFYTATLDPARDLLVELRPPDVEENLWTKPWTFQAPGHEGFGEPRVMAGPVATTVVVPFASEQATGESRYTFFARYPALKIARCYQPRRPLTVHSAQEGCSLPQRGGTYALQGGTGALVERGLLHNSTKYRDLLFGYSAAHPGPENAKRVGWFDFSWPEEYGAGLGVVLEERWRTAKSRVYDVTRYYDGADWINVFYVFDTETTVAGEQRSVLYLVPHGYLNFVGPEVVPPAAVLWREVRQRFTVRWWP